jgi:hypothetical protein
VARELGMLPHEYMERVTPRQHLAYLLYYRRPSREHRYLAMIAYNALRPHLKDPASVSPDDFLIGFSKGSDGDSSSSRSPDSFSTRDEQEQRQDDGLTDDERLARAAHNSKLRWGRVMGRNIDGSKVGSK